MTDTYTYAETPGSEGAPLVFTFHGTGGSEDQFHALPPQILPDAHVISPRGDVSENGALRYFRRRAEGLYDMEDLARRTKAMAVFIAQHTERTNAKRVIGLGYSNGANILASVAFSQPELFTDLVLLHPLIPWTPEPQPGLSGKRVLITAGERDPICPAPMTRALTEWFADQGTDLRTVWHTGGHEIGETELAALVEFLTA